MTLRKVWLLVLVVVAALAIGINSLVLTSLTDKYFTDYLNESYELHVGQILDYAKNALGDEELSYERMTIDLETHLYDPIIGIKLYDSAGRLLLAVSSNYYTDNMSRMMGNRGMSSMFDPDINEKVEQHEIVIDGEVVGIMNITLHSSSENSFVARRFQSTLLMNSLISVGIAVLISLMIGIYVSGKMTRSLKDTETLAINLQLGEKINFKKTMIREISAIRDSLIDLNIRLKLKQKTRKSLVDQLVHQTRTPLTILKSHLEAFEDGVMDMDDKEIGVCKNQIDNINYIITNMSALIDAETEFSELNIEEFDIAKVVKQIIKGLKPQFDKKLIRLEIIGDQNVMLISDKNLLSQSIYNILTNAYKYTDPQGSVSISYTCDTQWLHLKIQDTGIGIKETDKDKIFEAYYRSSDVLSQNGEGIGLYFAKENVERIGGYIELESKVGSGSSFIIHVPTTTKKE